MGFVIRCFYLFFKDLWILIYLINSSLLEDILGHTVKSMYSHSICTGPSCSRQWYFRLSVSISDMGYLGYLALACPLCCHCCHNRPRPHNTRVAGMNKPQRVHSQDKCPQLPHLALSLAHTVRKLRPHRPTSCVWTSRQQLAGSWVVAAPRSDTKPKPWLCTAPAKPQRKW